MAIREIINQNPIVVIIAAIVVSAAAITASISQLHSRQQSEPDNVFFTDDDGKTWFADESKLVAPFDHGGKEAVQCYVFRCGSKKFVGYLLKYSPQGKDDLEKMHAAGVIARGISPTEILVKKPGDKSWMDQTNDKSRNVLEVRCPDDPNATVETVNP